MNTVWMDSHDILLPWPGQKCSDFGGDWFAGHGKIVKDFQKELISNAIKDVAGRSKARIGCSSMRLIREERPKVPRTKGVQEMEDDIVEGSMKMSQDGQQTPRHRDG